MPSDPPKEPPSKPATPRKAPKAKPKIEPPTPPKTPSDPGKKQPEPKTPSNEPKDPKKPKPSPSDKEPPIPQPKNPPASVPEPKAPSPEPPAPKKSEPAQTPEPPKKKPSKPNTIPPPAYEPNKPTTEPPAPKKAEPTAPTPEKSKIPTDWKVNADPTAVIARVEEQTAKSEGMRKAITILPLEDHQLSELKINKLVSENSPKDTPATISLNGEEWVLGKSSRRVVLLNKNDSSISVIIPRSEPISAYVLKDYARKAKEYRASENRDDAGMKKFDIADNKEPVGFVELYDSTTDVTNSIAGLPEVLSRRYNLQMTPMSRIDGSRATDPLVALTDRIQTMYDAGIRNFYVNISAHGDTRGIDFGGRTLDPKKLVELTMQFPDCKFTGNATSCHGGGIGGAMANFEDHSKAEQGRVTMFTQTKSDVVNAGYVVDEGFSTAYNIALARYLMQGVDGNPGTKLNYGEAHTKADQEAKGILRFDAEVRSSAPGKKSKYTADTGNSRSTEGQV